jgi:hypothetical protein
MYALGLFLLPRRGIDLPRFAAPSISGRDFNVTSPKPWIADPTAGAGGGAYGSEALATPSVAQTSPSDSAVPATAAATCLRNGIELSLPMIRIPLSSIIYRLVFVKDM